MEQEVLNERQQYLKDVLGLGKETIPGLKLAIWIVEQRIDNANKLYGQSYSTALQDVLVFLRAELKRQISPETAALLTMVD